MFGPQVFLRLFIRINQDLWPYPVLALLVGLAVPALLMNRQWWTGRLAMLLVAAAWFSSGYGFLVGYFGPINWPAAWFGWAFVAQGGLLALLAVSGAFSRSSRQIALMTAFWLLASLGLPWLTVVETGQWQALAVFALAPGTTTATSVLVAGLLQGPWRWIYLIIPVLWCLFSAAIFWVLQTWWLLLFPLATLLLAVTGLWLSPRSARSSG
ncbi:DUF6064 family protein [Marinobacter halotolerans]|uniref:DUF6064 family protein n=1 Tax=Marinobacter halotolerans TaxID=1569211 RepID=UPI001247AD8C|nr:DUF6064 family protein [Marinobacter halotolerans]